MQDPIEPREKTRRMCCSDSPDHRPTAAAIGYDPDSGQAPKLLAKGYGELADRIIALARKYDIPIREDRDLVAVLATLDLDQEIPPELYRAVAEILAFVYRLRAARAGA